VKVSLLEVRRVSADPTVANNDRKENVIFINVKAFGKTAENCDKYLKKGSKVLIVGDFSTYEYEKDGQKKYGYEVLANRVEFLDSKPKDDVVPPPDPDDYKTPIDNDEDIPF